MGSCKDFSFWRFTEKSSLPPGLGDANDSLIVGWDDLAGTDRRLDGPSRELRCDFEGDLPSITLFKLFTEPSRSRFDGVRRSSSFPEKLLGGTILAFVFGGVNRQRVHRTYLYNVSCFRSFIWRFLEEQDIARSLPDESFSSQFLYETTVKLEVGSVQVLVGGFDGTIIEADSLGRILATTWASK